MRERKTERLREWFSNKKKKKKKMREWERRREIVRKRDWESGFALKKI